MECLPGSLFVWLDCALPIPASPARHRPRPRPGTSGPRPPLRHRPRRRAWRRRYRRPHLASGHRKKPPTSHSASASAPCSPPAASQSSPPANPTQPSTCDRRAAIANHARAAACLSLHATESGAGVHLYTSSLDPAQATHFIAWKTAQAAVDHAQPRPRRRAQFRAAARRHQVTLGRTPLPGVDSMTCPAIAIEIAPERDSDGKVTPSPTIPNTRLASPPRSPPPCSRGDPTPTRTEARQP